VDYASTIAHFDAMMACRALNQPDEAAKHEKLLNALLDSMAKDGDGKTPDTSYFAATTQEEYIFMALRLNLKPKGQQSLIVQKGHFYDLLKVIDPKTNTTQDLWFNVDVQMNPDGQAMPNPANASKNAAAPVVAATAQVIAPGPSTPNGNGMLSSEGNTAPSKVNMTDDHLHTVEVHAQSSPPQTLYNQDGVSVTVTETQDALELVVSEPYRILQSVWVDRNQNGKFDPYVDIKYSFNQNRKVCAQYFIDENSSTICGGFPSTAVVKNEEVDQEHRQYTMVLPKEELSFGQPSTRLILVLWNRAQKSTVYYPSEKFKNAINVPYLINQVGAVQVESTKNGSMTGGSVGKSAPSEQDEVGTQLRHIAGKGAENCGEFSIGLRATENGAFAEASDCAEKAFAQIKRFYVRYSSKTRRIIMGLVIDGYASVGLAMGADGILYQSLSGMQNGQQLQSSLAPCPKPVQLKRDQLGGLSCATSRSPTSDSSSKDSNAPAVMSTAPAITQAKPESTSAQAVKHYTPKDEGFWAQYMNIGVTRTDAGSKYHFVVNFTVPNPAISSGRLGSNPLNLITVISVYSRLTRGDHQVSIRQDTLPLIAGDWKPGDPVRLEFDLPKEYADPSQGWSLRFCIGNKSVLECIPSSNLLVDSADQRITAANTESNVSKSGSDGVYKIGNNISAPVILKLVEAKFSDQARRAKYQGVCVISLIVDAQGNPQNPRVIRALGMGLDENALEAVRKFKFKPAMKDGKTPVPVMITVEVNFRLYNSADVPKPTEQGPHIRVENRSGMDFKYVVVNGKQYGDIKAGEQTGYQTMSFAYRYASVSLSTDTGPLAIHPIDYLGERRLGTGNYTYVITVQNNTLRIECVVD
jgi:TonB family protein